MLLHYPAEALAKFADCVVNVVACVSLNERMCSDAACQCVRCCVPLDIYCTIVSVCLVFADTLVFHFQFLHDGHLPDRSGCHDPAANPSQ